ncbi:MAG: DNA primase [Candidatus Magasanikbacteria bacterium]|nr:DNA primase [Candidatus Magasanikbacteria bacterium]
MSDTQLIKDKIDVADLVGEYVQLKPAGVNKKGLCPFHHEKSPSFMVNSERQSWHCFGCAKGGDIFSFIQEIEGMEFVEALKFLANRAGVPLTNVREDTSKSQKNRIKDINAAAASFFHNFLLKITAAQPAREYLERRQIKAETIDAWQIGFISDQWDLLTQYLLKKNFGIDDLVASGLTIKRDNADPVSKRGFYDRFRGRVMFPIWDVHGTVVGFTGRVLVETEHSGGKYVNTPQTLVYDKSRVVFGLDKAKQEIKRKDLVVMVEGQMDVIACHQAGMKNVVATSGTAMTEEQVQLLKRYSNNIAIAFDADAAGQNAAKRGIEIALSAGLGIKIITIPDGAGKDADECLKKNPEVWFSAVQNAEDIMNWYFVKAFAGKDVSNPKHKQQIVDILLPDIGRIPYAVERDYWLRELGGRLNVDVSVLKEDMVRLKANFKFQAPNPKQISNDQTQKERPKTRLDILTERLLILLLRYPKILEIRNLKFDIPFEAALSTPAYSPLYEMIKKRYTSSISWTIDDLRHESSSSEVIAQIDTLQMQGDLLFGDIKESDAKEELELITQEIKKEWKHKRLQDLQRALVEAEREHDLDRLAELHKEFENLK